MHSIALLKLLVNWLMCSFLYEGACEQKYGENSMVIENFTYNGIDIPVIKWKLHDQYFVYVH
jgi:hypothetical protein